MGTEAANPIRRRRNRVPVSCFHCRALKTKCDNTRPVCATCARNGRQCIWVQQGISGGTGREESLRREKHLEAIEGAQKRANTNSQRLPDDAAVYDGLQSPHMSRSREPTASTASMTAQQQPGPSSSSIVVDANVSIGTSFTQLILNSIYGRDSTTHAVTTMDEMRTIDRPGLCPNDDLYALPANTAAVLNRYFDYRHLLMPLFHQPSAKLMFDAAMHCPPEERHRHRLAFILLNMILALCTSHWLEDRATHTARKYYDIAMTLLQPTLLREWTLEYAQALLLGARYLQTTSRGDECWNILGLVIRIAYGLRLHQEPPNTDPPPLRETKRRVWYVAYMLDMHWSMVYERPPATRSSDFSVSLPEDLDDDCIQEQRMLYPSPRQPSHMSFFLQNIKLYRIVEKAIIAGTAERKRIVSSRNTAELVASLDEDYQTWLRERPEHLILDSENAHEPAWILALRGNMVCNLIHRQSLELSLHHKQARPEQQPEEDSSMTSNILRASHRTCVTAAIESVDIVALRHEQTKKTAGLVFNAVITLVSYMLNPLYSYDRHALDKMDKALHMIKSMSTNHSFAKWAHSFLQQLTSYMHYMHQSLGPQQEVQRQQNHTISDGVAVPQTTGPTGFPAGSSDTFLDLHTIFGHAKDLSVNLETQLESFNPEDLTADPMWMLSDEGHAI